MNDLVKQGYDKSLVSLGFYPMQLSENKKLLKVADVKNNRELHFELENYTFEIANPEKVKEVPEHIKEFINSSEKKWFEEYKIIKPIEDDWKQKRKQDKKQKLKDPILIGISQGKMYYIGSWGMDIWDR